MPDQDPFAGLTQVNPAPSASATEDPFKGLEEVPAPAASDSFAGLKEADSLDLKESKELATDDSFRPAQYVAENPHVMQEPEKYQKLLDVYRQKRVNGLNFGKVAAAAAHEAPGILAKTAKGAGQLVKRVVDIGVQPAVNEALGFVTGTDMAPLREETRRNQLKSAGEIAAGTEQAVTGLAQLGGQAARKLFGKKPGELTDRELEQQLLVDSEFHKATNSIAQGNGDFSKATGLDADFLSKNGVTLDQKAIENLSLVDPLTLVATAGVFKVVGVGGKIIASAATKLGAEAVINGLQKVAGKSLQVAGQAVSATGKVVQKVPLRNPSLAAIGGTLASGNVPGAIASAAAPTVVKAGGKALQVAGQALTDVGQAVTPGFIGPPTAAAARIAKMVASPAGQIATGVAKGAAVGGAVAAPLALAADENQTAGAILGGGIALGGVAGGAHAATNVGAKAVSNFVASKFFDPHSIPFEPVQSPGYGIDKSLDVTHDAAMQTLTPPEQNAVNNFREAVRAQGGEIYVQDPKSYGDRIRQSLIDENGGQPLTPEQEAKATAYADTHAEFDGFITDAAGNQRRVVFLNGGAKGLPHDAGHLFQSLLSPERQGELRQAVLESYTPQQLEDFGKAYTERLGDPEYFNKLGEEAGREKIADEIIAENFSQLFGNTPLADLKAPPKFLEKLGRSAAEAGESLGLDLTGGRVTPDLQATPSVRLQNILRNASQEVLNKPAVKEKLTLTKATLPEKPVVPGDIIPFSPKPEAPPVAEIPKVGETPVPKAPVEDAAAARAKVTGIAEAKELAKDNPEAAQAVETISKSMEAGNPALRIEHRGITSEAKTGPREEARGSRRGTQESGYAELERLQIENRKNAPESVVSVHEKTFVPVRWVNQGGKATLVAMSMDKILANMRKITEEAASKKADNLIPYESVGGELTEKGWNDALADVKTYAENQSNGYRGDGSSLVRPSDEAGVSIPAENPNYTPTKLGEAQANFANLVQGIAPPETARSVKGTIPGNVKAQLVAEANLKTPQPVAQISAKHISKQAFGKPFEGRTVKETNPLRNQLASKGVNVRALTEATERFAAQDIVNTAEAPASAQMKAPVTDTIRGGFLPKDRPVKETITAVESATPDEWSKAFGPQQSLTKSAYEVGLNLKTPEELAALRDAQNRASDNFKEAMAKFKAGDTNAMAEAYAQGSKGQFFREAYEAATDTGSAAGSYGWRKAFPEGKPPFSAKAPAANARLEAMRPERLFLPADSIDKTLDPIKRAAIRTQSGNVYEGAWHGEAYTNLADAIANGTANEKLPPGVTSLTDLLDSVMSGEPSEGAKDFVEDGFVTESGKFLNRAQALDHAEKIGQLKAGAPTRENSARSVGVLESKEFENERSFLPKGDKKIRDLAAEYMKSANLPYKPTETYAPMNPELGKKLADFYEEAKSAPDDPAVLKSYKALADETLAQYKAMTDAGYKIEPWTGEGEPYKNSEAAVNDIRENKHLYFLQTGKQFGMGEKQASNNPMLDDSGVVIDGHHLPVNDVFRAVHDFFGHGKEGYQFGPRGEFNTWRTHSEMYSPEAQGALAAETLAQNAWVNFGKHLRNEAGNIPQKGESGYKAPAERPFGEQKNVVVPEELIQEAKASAGPAFLPKTEAGKQLAKDGFELQMDESADNTQYVLRAMDPQTGEDVGRIEFHIPDFDQGEIRDIEVNPEFRDKGIGEALYREAGQAMKDLGVTKVSGEIISPAAYHLRKKVFPNTKNVRGAEFQADYTTVSKIGPRSKFLPAKRKVEASDIQKRDEQNRPLTAEGLVDYEKLYKEKTIAEKKRQEQDDAELAAKIAAGKYYTGPVVKAGEATGWILPDKEFVPLDSVYHEDFLSDNAKELNSEFKTKFKDTADVYQRLEAVNQGFVRVRYTPKDGGMKIEVGSAHFTPQTKRAILKQLEEHADKIDKLDIAVLNPDGNTVDSVSEKVMDLEGADKVAAMKDALGQLNAGKSERRNVGPTDIQRARAMGQTREPQFLPTKGEADTILKELKEASPDDGTFKLVGSVAKGKENAKDIDISVDYGTGNVESEMGHFWNKVVPKLKEGGWTIHEDSVRDFAGEPEGWVVTTESPRGDSVEFFFNGNTEEAPPNSYPGQRAFLPEGGSTFEDIELVKKP